MLPRFRFKTKRDCWADCCPGYVFWQVHHNESLHAVLCASFWAQTRLTNGLVSVDSCSHWRPWHVNIKICVISIELMGQCFMRRLLLSAKVLPKYQNKRSSALTPSIHRIFHHEVHGRKATLYCAHRRLYWMWTNFNLIECSQLTKLLFQDRDCKSNKTGSHEGAYRIQTLFCLQTKRQKICKHFLVLVSLDILI